MQRQIVLIGNYPSDKQESMLRFAQMLCAGIQQAGLKCTIWQPKVLISASFKSTTNGFGKWLGYIDKFLLFPIILKWRMLNKSLNNQHTHFHVCDHSNAPYLPHLPLYRRSITCHDVLAIRGALGFNDAYCEASKFGKILQRWIRHHLLQADKISCDSELTLKQLTELSGNTKRKNKDWRVIHNAFNGNFKPMKASDAISQLKSAGIHDINPFILHVGSASPRKNRKLLIDMVNLLGKQWKGKICFAGELLEPHLGLYAQSLGLSDRIVSIVKPEHDTLLALYSTCEAFIFPSYSEGFGWPLIEAQACGAPVVASNIEPLPEISGNTALHYDPSKPQNFAEALIWLQDTHNRSELVQKGYQNTMRFDIRKMTSEYLKLCGLDF